MTARFRLCPTPNQATTMIRHNADARFVWNLALEQANVYRAERGPTPNNTVRMRQLTEARAGTWLGEGSSVVQQGALRDFDQALKNWWGGTHRRPTWRKAGQSEGFRVRDVSITKHSRKWGTVCVPKVGPVRFRLTRPWADVCPATSARITLDRSGRWHVSFVTSPPAFERTSTGSMVGLDMGIASSVATSDGEHLRMPALLSSGEIQRKRRLERQMARQVKGSNRRTRTKLDIAKLAAREKDRRKDWIEQTTTRLVRQHDFVAIENLKIKNMVRSARATIEAPGKRVRQKTGLNRSIHNQAWATFRTRLSDKAAAATLPVAVVAINPVNTSRRCSGCGHVARESRESQSRFACVACGYTANADVNAAVNILAAGQAVSGRGGISHAPAIPVDQAQRPDEASTLRKVVA